MATQRQYSQYGTLSVSTTTDLNIPKNVEISTIMIGQAATENFDIQLFEDGVFTKGFLDETMESYKHGSNHYYTGIRVNCSIKIVNNSGANQLTYLVMGQEYL